MGCTWMSTGDTTLEHDYNTVVEGPYFSINGIRLSDHLRLN